MNEKGNYIRDKDKKKLADVAKKLASHEEDVKQFYRSQFSLQLGEVKDPLEKMKIIFYTQTKARRGGSKDRSEKAFVAFSGGIEDEINKIAKYSDKEHCKAHNDFLKWLCGIKHIDQKIANLFLKLVVMFSEDFKIDCLDFPAWKEHLHVPLDLWVTRLLGKEYLDVGTDIYNQHFKPGSIPSYQSPKYRHLQADLKEVTSQSNLPSIMLDALWFVGYNFCSYDKYLCDRCWVNSWCTNYKPRIEK
jgi:hypothetical protein